MSYDMKLLPKLLEHRFDYEERARDRILEKLTSDEIRKIFRQGGLKGVHRICVFGESNVGKTTLILKLLGIKTKAEDDEYNILTLGRAIRGNSDKKGAGTSTVFQYSVNEEDIFLISYPDGSEKKLDDLAALESCLDEIRAQVENNEWTSLDPVKIRLNSQYFVHNRESNWVITDIPGINSKASGEHAHVNKIIQTWILGSNVILVLTTANQLNSLKSKSLMIPGYGPWFYLGRRCRLIVSHAFAQSSIRESFKELNFEDSSSVISYYRKEIEKQGIDLTGIGELYPLDYGETWENLSNHHPEIYNTVNPFMREFFNKLSDSLEKSLSPQEEFKSLMDITKLEKRVESDLKHLRKEWNDKVQELKGITDKRIGLVRKLESKKDILPSLNRKIEDWKSKRSIKFNRPDYHGNSEAYDKNSTDERDREQKKHEDRLTGWLTDFSKKITGDETKLTTLIGYNGFSRSWWEYDPKRTSNFRGGYHGLERVLRLKNFFKHAKTNHSKAFRDMIFDQFGYWEMKITEAKDQFIHDKINSLEDDISAESQLQNALKIKLSGLETEIYELKSEIEELQADIKYREKIKTEDFTIFKNEYPKIRKEELQNDIFEQLSEINNSTDAHAIEQRLAYINSLEEQFNTM